VDCNLTLELILKKIKILLGCTHVNKVVCSTFHEEDRRNVFYVFQYTSASFCFIILGNQKHLMTYLLILLEQTHPNKVYNFIV